MYLPYLRGKQYELIAVRELASMLATDGHTIPIIEPVRMPAASGLGRFAQIVGDAGLPFVIIINPTVGELANGDVAPELIEFVKQSDPGESWNIGVVLQEGVDTERLINQVEHSFGFRAVSLIHRSAPPREADLVTLTAKLNRVNEVIDDDLRQRHFRDLLAGKQGVTLRDGFVPEDRNADYLDRTESVFTEDHLYFAEEGWYGFSDFLTIGERFSEGGFTPRAVAIHWTFERPVGGEIWIRHFTSTTNNVIGDAGGKFLEAAAKLVQFLDDNGIPDTRASVTIRQHLAADTFPGLGVVKKLSIQNHLELVSKILSRS